MDFIITKKHPSSAVSHWLQEFISFLTYAFLEILPAAEVIGSVADLGPSQLAWFSINIVAFGFCCLKVIWISMNHQLGTLTEAVHCKFLGSNFSSGPCWRSDGPTQTPRGSGPTVTWAYSLINHRPKRELNSLEHSEVELKAQIYVLQCPLFFLHFEHVEFKKIYDLIKNLVLKWFNSIFLIK